SNFTRSAGVCRDARHCQYQTGRGSPLASKTSSRYKAPAGGTICWWQGCGSITRRYGMDTRNAVAPKVGLPDAPRRFSPDAIFQGVHWHQRWEIFQGVFVPGINPVKDLCELSGLPADLSGKRVLDVGAWNGCFSFECERRGADEVVAFGPENPEEVGFNR